MTESYLGKREFVIETYIKGEGVAREAILEPTAESLMAGWMFAESVQLVFKTRLSKWMKMPNYGCAEPVLNIAHFSVQHRLSEAGGVLHRRNLVSCRE